jgi:hypothetical protein
MLKNVMVDLCCIANLLKKITTFISFKIICYQWIISPKHKI